MKNFYSVNDFSLYGDDTVDTTNILKEKFSKGKKIDNKMRQLLLNQNIDMSYYGEFFVKLNQQNENLGQYFNVINDKIGSRGLGYYGLFGDIYKIENRSNYKNIDKYFDTFWKEYGEYIDQLSSIQNNEKLKIIYLDNYRNFLLLWINILIFLKQSSKKNDNRPISNLSFNYLNGVEDNIQDFIKNFIDLYEKILENIISLFFEKDIHINELPDIKDLFLDMKELFNKEKTFTTKKGKYSFQEFFSLNHTNAKIWFEKIFRNNREEDNIGVIFSFFLQKKIDKINSKKDLEKLLKEERTTKEKYILSSLYGGIELSLIAKYLGYKAGFINYSVYNLKQKDIYKNISDISYDIHGKLNKSSEVVIVDDNIGTGKTMEKISSLLQSNHIPVKLMATPRIFLSSKEKNVLKSKNVRKSYKTITLKISSDLLENFDKKWADIVDLKGIENVESLNINLSSLLNEVVKKYLYKYGDVINFKDIKKVISLNAMYILPRVERKGRVIDITIGRKINSFRRKFGKEFRSL